MLLIGRLAKYLKRIYLLTETKQNVLKIRSAEKEVCYQ